MNRIESLYVTYASLWRFIACCQVYIARLQLLAAMVTEVGGGTWWYQEKCSSYSMLWQR